MGPFFFFFFHIFVSIVIHFCIASVAKLSFASVSKLTWTQIFWTENNQKSKYLGNLKPEHYSFVIEVCLFE